MYPKPVPSSDRRGARITSLPPLELALAVPGWTTPVSYVLLFVGIVASAAGIILLALPMANEYFRRPQPICRGRSASSWAPNFATPGSF